MGEGSALEGREKLPRTDDVLLADASRAPAGAPPERTEDVRYEPVVSPPANISRPSRPPCCGALGRRSSCLDGSDCTWKIINYFFEGGLLC